MKYLLVFILLSVLTNKISCENVGYSDLITIGPNHFVVGINLNIANYPANTAYNIPNPNDPTDVHRILQKAITDIGNIGGGDVYIKEGLYVLISNINFFGHHIHLKGDGIDRTIIKLANFAPPFIFGSSKRSGFIRTRSFSNLIISQMTVDGNKNNQYTDEDHEYGRYGLFTEGSENIWFDNVKVLNFQGYGIDPHGWKSEGVWGNHLTITNCISQNNNWDGFTLDQTFNIYVKNCTAINNGRHGFNIVTGSKYVTLINNIASNNGFDDPHGGSGCGFSVQNNQLFGTSDVSLNNNYIGVNKKAGFCLNDVFNINILNNVINDVTGTCFNLVDTRSTVIKNNYCNTRRVLVSTGTTIVNSPGVSPYVYFYNNTFGTSATSGNTTPSTSTSTTTTTGIPTSTTGSTTGQTSSSACTYRDMKCVTGTTTTYQTCNKYENGNTYWGVYQFCGSGLVCQPSGNVIYCV